MAGCTPSTRRLLTTCSLASETTVSWVRPSLRWSVTANASRGGASAPGGPADYRVPGRLVQAEVDDVGSLGQVAGVAQDLHGRGQLVGAQRLERMGSGQPS